MQNPFFVDDQLSFVFFWGKKKNNKSKGGVLTHPSLGWAAC